MSSTDNDRTGVAGNISYPTLTDLVREKLKEQSETIRTLDSGQVLTKKRLEEIINRVVIEHIDRFFELLEIIEMSSYYKDGEMTTDDYYRWFRFYMATRASRDFMSEVKKTLNK